MLIQLSDWTTTKCYCALIITIHLQNFFHLEKLKLWVPMKHSNSPFTSPPAPRNHLSILSLWLWVLQVPHVNRLIEYVSFYDWLIWKPSRFIHVVLKAHGRIPPFLKLNNIPLYRYTTLYLSTDLSMDPGVISRFWWLWIVLPWTSVFKYLFKTLLSIICVYAQNGTAESYGLGLHFKIKFCNHNSKRHMYPNIHCSAVYNSQDMEAT